MDYKKAGQVSNWFFITSIIAIVGTLFFKDPSQRMTQLILFFIGIALIIGGIVVRIIFWRCPKCKKMLTLGYRLEPDKCPRCRASLLSDEEKK
ncbi:MAG: hypothetical protein IKI20_04240 [Lachnospiraceae bacterium]|nr:hypothetical protein [Lachnospiraceae bacterium]